MLVLYGWGRLSYSFFGFNIFFDYLFHRWYPCGLTMAVLISVRWCIGFWGALAFGHYVQQRIKTIEQPNLF
ncbi:hypothetical protein PN36_35210 [Candidatus Thiomargarita nelsonii]|uniref:Uncharacterized protein n=1 Tax=Candidatus Thiomargarita nelsonii TaxID=1003181 RepID=A0A4E0RAG7_9GAMM|nr:hypothetical protein PN36_35210 [Candidatus Thiomargarita nelsonii]